MGQSGLWMEEPQEASPGEGGPDCSPRLGCGRRRAVRAGCRAAVREEEEREVRTDPKRSRGVEREWPRAQMCRLVLQKLLRPPASPL